MDKKQIKHMVELFDSLSIEKKLIFMDTLERLATEKDNQKNILSDAGAIIDRTIELFEVWRELPERLKLGVIFHGAYLTTHKPSEVTTSDIDELTGFVGAMRMFRKL